MNESIYAALNTLIAQCFLAVYVTRLVVFREPLKRWRRLWLILVSVIVLANIMIIAFAGAILYNRFGVLLLLIPYNLATLLCAKYRDFRTLFGVANGTFIGSISQLNRYVVEFCFSDLSWLPWLSILTQVITLSLLYFPIRRFSSVGRKMMAELKRGWLILWLLPLGSSMACMYVYNQFFSVRPVASLIAQYSILAVCAVSYYLMYLFFEQVQTKNEMENSQKLLALQVTGLKSRIAATNAAEDRLRIDRHDLRHRLELVREMVQRGENEEALKFVDRAQQKLDDSKPVKWCQPPILDAMFTSYFNQAETQSVRVYARLELPEILPIDEGEFAIVLANALENAINACTELPVEMRELRCTVIAQPSLMLEVSNPYPLPITFDADGLPVSSKEGHGFGTRSMVAFCEKYGAVYSFAQNDNCFTMQIVL